MLITSCKNNTRLRWDMFIMILSVYNAFLIPFQISFGIADIYLNANNFMENALDIFFLVDNVLMFLTTYIN